jgi:hypothetical protein
MVRASRLQQGVEEALPMKVRSSVLDGGANGRRYLEAGQEQQQEQDSQAANSEWGCGNGFHKKGFGGYWHSDH